MKYFLIIHFALGVVILSSNLWFFPNIKNNEIIVLEATTNHNYEFESNLNESMIIFLEKELGQTNSRVFVRILYDNYFNYLRDNIKIFLTVRIFNDVRDKDLITKNISDEMENIIDADNYITNKIKWESKIIIHFNEETIIKDL